MLMSAAAVGAVFSFCWRDGGVTPALALGLAAGVASGGLWLRGFLGDFLPVQRGKEGRVVEVAEKEAVGLSASVTEVGDEGV